MTDDNTIGKAMKPTIMTFKYPRTCGSFKRPTPPSLKIFEVARAPDVHFQISRMAQKTCAQRRWSVHIVGHASAMMIHCSAIGPQWLGSLSNPSFGKRWNYVKLPFYSPSQRQESLDVQPSSTIHLHDLAVSGRRKAFLEPIISDSSGFHQLKLSGFANLNCSDLGYSKLWPR